MLQQKVLNYTKQGGLKPSSTVGHLCRLFAGFEVLERVHHASPVRQQAPP